MKKCSRRFEAVPLSQVIDNPAVKPIGSPAEKLLEKERPHAVRGKYKRPGRARDSERGRK
ncbi:MAG: hypothetical protein WAM65_01725 [Candidatus Korobacteraceae bacterium]